MNSDDTSIRPANGMPPPRPPANDSAIQAASNVPAKPPGLSQTGFLSRARQLLQMHDDLAGRSRTPPMWGFVQAGAFALAIVMAFGVYHALPADSDMGGVMFILTFFGVLFAPDGLLYMSRRTRKTIIRQNLEDAIRVTVRNYPDEVEHCGGITVLVDRVELAALVEVLDNQAKADFKKPDPKKG